MKYRKKPVVIEARQFETNNDDGSHIAELTDWVNSFPEIHASHDNTFISIFWRDGTVQVDVGDWIIKGTKGELYLCKPDIFAATYEPERECADCGKRGESLDKDGVCPACNAAQEEAVKRFGPEREER